MKTSLIALTALIVLLLTPAEAAAARYGGHGHGGGGYRGGGHWSGYGGHWGGGYRGSGYRGGYYGGHYYGGAWPYLGLGLGLGLGALWARPYPAYYPAPVYHEEPPPPPYACGRWIWDEPGYAWIWEPCAPGGPAVVMPEAPAPRPAPVAPQAPPAPVAPMTPRG